ncbi:hypothetical protein [Allocoleopsis sp.]|uniref:hypothetical protein n=1 Tax=Allocoleopsis sp. TaxID=3088169 RepID=UPI002FD0301E
MQSESELALNEPLAKRLEPELCQSLPAISESMGVNSVWKADQYLYESSSLALFGCFSDIRDRSGGYLGNRSLRTTALPRATSR